MRIDIFSIIKKIEALEAQKAVVSDRICGQAELSERVGKEIANQYTLMYVEELTELQKQIDELKYLTVEVSPEIRKAVLKK